MICCSRNIYYYYLQCWKHFFSWFFEQKV